MATHEMHAEFISVDRTVIENILLHLDENIIATGTTSLRTLESLYWLGVKLAVNKEPYPGLLTLDQWEVYEMDIQDMPAKKAMMTLLDWMKKNNTQELLAKTQIIIAPGYSFRIIKGLVTNFHQPQSTLLLLVAALIGDDWRKVYNYALKNQFRFLSYGDGSLLWNVG